jgi:hypothetical protein
MASNEVGTNDVGSRAKVKVEVTRTSESSTNNTSQVRIEGTVSDNSINLGGFSDRSSWKVTLDGVQRGSGSLAYNFTGNSGRSYKFFDQTFTITHDRNGSKTVSGSAEWAGDDGLTGSATATTSLTLTDFVRLPTTPAAPTLSRSNNRTSLTITGATATFYGSARSYQYQISTDNGTNWSTAATLGSGTANRVSTITVANTDTIIARTRGKDSEGNGSWSLNSDDSVGAPSAPTVNVSRSGLIYTITGSSTGSISKYQISIRSSTDGGVVFSEFGANSDVTGTTSYNTNFTSSLETSYQFRVRASSTEGLFSNYTTSETFHTPAVPTIPETAISLSRSVRDVTIDWESFLTNTNEIAVYNGAIINSYDIEERYSSDGGATWIADYTNITNTPFSTTVFLANNRLIAKTYQFRVRAVSDVGPSTYQESSTIFISAYGSRSNGAGFVPIETAKIFLGIGQVGADGAGWKTIENVKRFVGVGQPGADASGWTDLQT